MILKRTTLLILLITGFITSAFAQRDTLSLNTILAKTTKFSTDYPIEKVYLHLDKPYYAAGDTIWFKAYITIDKHQPTTLSNVVYVDVTNARDSTVQLLKLPVTNGVANGMMVLLPESYPQGNYHLRAYTAWMRNFDPDYFFNKNIAIGNSVDNSVKTNVAYSTVAADGKVKINADITYNEASARLAGKKVSWTVTVNGSEISKGKGTTDANGVLNVGITGANTAAFKNSILTTTIDLGEKSFANNSFSLKNAIGTKDVQFFPEGGELITGIRSKVAFKAINADGLGVNVKGNITDSGGNEVAVIQSQHLGMGMFALTPEEGKSYKANITFPDGSISTYYLPRVLPGGINLSIYNNDPENLNLKISSNTAFYQANQGKHFYIVAQIGGAVFFAAQTDLATQVYSAAIPKTKFPTGVIQFTLFNARGYPVSERLVFIQRNDALNLSIVTDKKIYNTRQNVKMSVFAKNKILPVQGNFSVAVIDESKTPFDENNETTILSNMLLTSELKGYIEKPNYYFIPKNATAAEDLDVLMLTQGYRRIMFSNILANKFPPVYLLPEQNGIEISGMLRNNTGLPVSKGNLRLQIPGKQSTEAITDMSGNFKFSKLAFRDSLEVVLSARNNVNSKNLVISVNGESVQQPSINAYANDEIVNIDSTFKPYMVNSKKRYDNLHILKEVVIKSTVVKKPSHLDYPAFSGLSEADQTITKERFQDCPSLLSCLPSIVLGITADKGELYLMRSFNSGNKKPIQIFVNGKPVDANYLNGLSGKEVESIEVFNKDGVSGINNQYNTNGILVITMRKINKTKITFAQLQELVPPPNILTFMPFGYGNAREFYSPKYTVTKAAPSNTDLRSTIYWNPKVITDKTTGLTTFDFFNADGRGTYRATIEGFDADGNIGRSVIRYTVK